jgi:hypothetical protein
MGDYSEADWEQDYKKLLQIYPNTENIINNALQTTNIKGPIGKLWNATRVLTAHGGKSNRSGIEWNHLFRRLGYSGFNDTGNGAYAQFEYPQAVFFSTDAIKIMDIAVNKVYNDSKTKRLVGNRTQSNIATLNKVHRVLGKLLALDSSLKDIIKDPIRIDNSKPAITLTNGYRLDVRGNNNSITFLAGNRPWMENIDLDSQTFKKTIKSILIDEYIIPVIEYSVKNLADKLSTKKLPFKVSLPDANIALPVVKFRFDIGDNRGSLGIEYNSENQSLRIQPHGFKDQQREVVRLSGLDNIDITYDELRSIVMPKIEEKIYSILDSFSESETSWVSNVKKALSWAVENINDNGWANEDEEGGEPWEEVKWEFSFDRSKNKLYIDNQDYHVDPIGYITTRGSDLLCYDSDNKLVKTISNYKDLNDDDLQDEIADYTYSL